MKEAIEEFFKEYAKRRIESQLRQQHTSADPGVENAKAKIAQYLETISDGLSVECKDSLIRYREVAAKYDEEKRYYIYRTGFIDGICVAQLFRELESKYVTG